MSYDINEWIGVAKEQESGTDACIPLFYTKAVEDKRKSDEEGRPVFKNVPYVRILIPGDSKSMNDRAVKEEDKKRWPKQWAKYEEGQSEAVEGTPVEQWAYLTPARAAELKALNIRTVEQLSQVADGNLKSLGMNGRDLVDRAKQFLQGDDETVKDLRKEMRDLRAEVKRLKAENRELKSPKREATDE